MINGTDLLTHPPGAEPMTTQQTAPEPTIALECGHVLTTTPQHATVARVTGTAFCPGCGETRDVLTRPTRRERSELRHQRRLQLRQLNASGGRQRTMLRLAVAAVPVILVNAVAFSGQLAFLRTHLPWSLPGQVLMAVALESVAVYLAFHAHVAQLANDSALRLRFSAYAFALVIGTMNYSHYARDWRPTFVAVAVGLMSASSPWLWAVHSRRASRDALMAAGLIEPHALRLGAIRWTWYPIRSARVMWLATWEGITDPAQALAASRAAQLPPLELDGQVLGALSARDRLAIAFGAVGALDVPRALALLRERGAAIDDSHAYQVRRAIMEAVRPGGDDS